MAKIKIKIQQRSVYHKIAEVEIEVDADVYEHYRLDNGKYTSMDDYLWDNEHLWSEKIDEKIIDKVLEEKPEKVIVLDSLFENNDQLKSNTVLQMGDGGIELKVV